MIGFATIVVYIYLNYLMVDEEMNEMLTNLCTSLRYGRKGPQQLDQSAHSASGLLP